MYTYFDHLQNLPITEKCSFGKQILNRNFNASPCDNSYRSGVYETESTQHFVRNKYATIHLPMVIISKYHHGKVKVVPLCLTLVCLPT